MTDIERVYYENGVLVSTSNALKSFTLDVSATSIYGKSPSSYAFYNCKDLLESFTIPDGSQLETIESYSFYSCTKLSGADFSKCSLLKRIGPYSFYSCTSLSTLILPESIQSLGAYSFYNTIISSLFIPDSVSSIGEYSFFGTQLNSFTFGSNSKLTNFSNSLFRNSNITSITIPKSLTTIGASVFETTKHLLEINVQEGNPHYFSINGSLYDSRTMSLIRYPTAKVSDPYIMPENITKIGPVSADNSLIKSIVFSPVLETIGDYSIQSSILLSEIDLPNSLKSLGTQSFYNCPNLKTVHLPNSITAIPKGCFMDTGIETIIIPDSITVLYDNCFKNCKNLGNVQLPVNISKIGGGVFSNCPNINLTFDPSSDLYLDPQYLLMNKNQTYASQFLGSNSTVIVPSTIEILKAWCFSGNTVLTTILFNSSNTLIAIEEYCFSGCSHLSTIEFPSSLKSIGLVAFKSCVELNSISFSHSLIAIGKEAFQYCNSLQDVQFSDTDENLIIEKDAFANCQNLRTVKLPEGIQSIGDYCFCNCYNLTSITIPESLSSLGSESLSNTSITEINMPELTNLTKISLKLFYNCSQLHTVTLCSSIEVIESEAFAYTSIKTIRIPRQVRQIDNKCFSHCSFLETFEVPSSESLLETFGSYVFEYCSSLHSYSINNSHYISELGVMYSSNKEILQYFPPASPIQFFSLPSELKEISITAFYKCTHLLEVLIPDNSTKKIGESAFEMCDHLRYINIPSCVQTIEPNAFKGCSQLSCGLLIEDVNSIQSQLISACLPTRCFHSCTYTAINLQHRCYSISLYIITLVFTTY